MNGPRADGSHIGRLTLKEKLQFAGAGVFALFALIWFFVIGLMLLGRLF